MVEQLRNQHWEHLRRELATLAEIARRQLRQEPLASRLDHLSQALSGAGSDSGPSPAAQAQTDAAHLLDAAGGIARSLQFMASTRQEPAHAGWTAKANEALAELLAFLRKERAARLKGLYVIADPEAARGQDLASLVESALKGGAKAIQLRDKRADKGAQLLLARPLVQMCRDRGALFFANDHADLAVAVGADGLHVGQGDLPIEDARQSLLPYQLVGTSNALVDEAHASEAAGADYLAVGAMFPTATKLNTRPAGVQTLRQVRQITNLPLVAIGGINAANAAEVVMAGADAICVTSAVLAAEDPEAAAIELAELIDRGLDSRRAF